MFTPRYVKHSKLLIRHAQKYLRYKRDILEPASYDLCAQHADRFTVPVGWTREDRRRPAPPPMRPEEPEGDDLFGIRVAV